MSTSTPHTAPAVDATTDSPLAQTHQVVRAHHRALTRRPRLVAAALAVLVLGLVTMRVLLGDYHVTPADFVRILRGDVIPGASFIVLESKLPRAVLGVLSGAVLGVAGSSMQRLMRNPLASPDLLGLSGGASAGAVFALVALGVTGPAVSLAAFAGAALVAAGLLLLSGRGAGARTRMVVFGVGLGGALLAGVHAMLLRADIYRAHDAMVWLTGSLARATWEEIARLAIVAAVLLPLLLWCSRGLALLALGEEVAGGLGVPILRFQAVVIVLVVLLVAACTAVCGPIAFVALLAGPIASALRAGTGGTGPVSSGLVAAGLTGAALVVGADHAAAYAIPGANLPVGVLTGGLGALFLLSSLVLTARESR